MKRLFDKYSSDLTGLFWLFFALFVGVALLSYSPQDPSLNALTQNAKPHNLCGYRGSYLADLLYQSFGLPAWVVVIGAARPSIDSSADRQPRRQ